MYFYLLYNFGAIGNVILSFTGLSYVYLINLDCSNLALPKYGLEIEVPLASTIVISNCIGKISLQLRNNCSYMLSLPFILN